MLRHCIVATLLLLSFISCNRKKPADNKNAKRIDSMLHEDVHTHSNADSIEISHLDLDIKVNMQQKQIAGSATWTINNAKNKQKELRLDTYEMGIDSVSVDGKSANFRLDSPTQFLGSALRIPILPKSKQVKIYYKTGRNAKALQWLEPSQTYDKKTPVPVYSVRSYICTLLDTLPRWTRHTLHL